MNTTNVNEMIPELERIASLYDKRKLLIKSVDAVGKEAKLEAAELEKTNNEALKKFKEEKDAEFCAKRPSIAAACMTMPPLHPGGENAKEYVKDILVASTGLGIILCIAFYVLFSVLDLVLLAMIFFAAGIACAVFWFKDGADYADWFVDHKKMQAEWEAAQKEWEDNFNTHATEADDEQFLEKFRAYDDSFLKFVDMCADKYKKERVETDQKLEEIYKHARDKKNELQAQISQIDEQLREVTLIHSDLFGNAKRIAKILSNGRADSLKEAINIALDDERKEREEELRREEARKAQELLEEQAIEAERHNQEIERAAERAAREAREHNMAMQRAAEEEARREKDQQRAAESAAVSRCMGCANNLKCTPSQKRVLGACGGYRPK